MKRLTVLGSTGSIGRQALDIVRAHSDDFVIFALAAGSKNFGLLAEQVKEFKPKEIVVPDERAKEQFESQYDAILFASSTKIACGPEALSAIAAHPEVDTVVSGVVGFLGLLPTAAAVRSGKTIALANKETLVAAGSIIMPMCKEYGATIVPVDSEHSAIHQSLSGYLPKDIKQIILTGSGGPFRTWTLDEIRHATIDDALRHPNWSMGPKITIDSATLMNKGLEIIEARWLFDLHPDNIRLIIHPQSILHSAVEFFDGSIVGQMGLPDMHLPIHYALYWPKRSPSTQVPKLDLCRIASLTFEEPDSNRFPCLKLAQEIAGRNDTMPCVLNAANEVAVQAALHKQIHFFEIPEYIQRIIDKHKPVPKPSLPDILEADRLARLEANELLGALAK